MKEAYQAGDQELDATEDINVKIYDFKEFGHMIQTQSIQTQLFTVSAYYMAKAILEEEC